MTIDAAARQHLGVMREFLDAQQSYALELDRTYEEVQDNGRKICLAEFGTLLVVRPNRVRSRFTSDRGDSDLCFDGQIARISHALRNAWVELPLQGNLKQLAAAMAERFNVSLPIADLLFPEPHLLRFDQAERADYLGLHLVDRDRCHHLAIEQAKLDWQLWIDAGAHPWPRKLVIEYKADPGSPLSLVTLRHWTANPPLDADSFRFVPPAGMQKITLT